MNRAKEWDAAQPQIARAATTMSVLLQMVEELTHDRWRYILHRHPINGTAAMRAGKWKQQSQRVAVADLGIPCEIALGHQMFEQEATHPVPQQVLVSHGYLLAARSWQSVGWPREAVRE